jgi:hypothetical protein
MKYASMENTLYPKHIVPRTHCSENTFYRENILLRKHSIENTVVTVMATKYTLMTYASIFPCNVSNELLL